MLIIPLASTRYCFAQLQRPVVSPFRPWRVNGKTSGYIETFDRFSLANIRGAGHEAMLFSPLPAFELISAFVFDKLDELAPRIAESNKKKKKENTQVRTEMEIIR